MHGSVGVFVCTHILCVPDAPILQMGLVMCGESSWRGILSFKKEGSSVAPPLLSNQHVQSARQRIREMV